MERPETEPFVVEGSFDSYQGLFEAEIFEPLPVSAELIQLDWHSGGGWGVTAAAYTNHRRQPRLALVPIDANGWPYAPTTRWVQSRQLHMAGTVDACDSAWAHMVEIVATVTASGLILRVIRSHGDILPRLEPDFYQQKPWK
jgi:hypothetical protein